MKSVPGSYSDAVRTNLVHLRRAKGLSQKTLAARAGLARTAVGRIERGQAGPRGATLSRLAEALGVNVAHLAQPVRPLTAVRFRARKRLPGRAAMLDAVSRWLDDYAWLDRQPPPCPLLADADDFAAATPEEAAGRARTTMGLDSRSPVRDICGLLEAGGIKVLVLQRQSDDFFGLSVGAADGGPAVVVNAWERIAVERWIFSGAHELGHLLLHPAEFEVAQEDESREAEREADRFAGAFLMPEQSFSDAWRRSRGHDLVTRVLKLKRQFRVSYRTVLHRLVATQRASPRIWGRFQWDYRTRTGRTLKKADEPHPLHRTEFAWNWRGSAEPAGLERYDFVEDRLARLVRTALEEQRISLSRAAEILNVDLTEVRRRARAWAV